MQTVQDSVSLFLGHLQYMTDKFELQGTRSVESGKTG